MDMAATADPPVDQRAMPGLAHELANLVQVVNGNLELLEGRIDDEPARRYLANARIAAEQLSELSRRLSAASRRRER